MRRVAVFEPVSQQTEPEPRIRLARSDTQQTVTIEAAVLIAQYGLPSGYILLVLDENCPYEEQLHFALVRDGEVVDHIVIGAPYATGIFKEIGIEGEVLRFSFSQDAVLSLSVREKGSRVPERLPPGARRKGGWFARHYLTLKEEVAP